MVRARGGHCLDRITNAGAARHVDELDAHLFTGDTFHDPHDRAALMAYLGRWLTRLGELELGDNEQGER